MKRDKIVIYLMILLSVAFLIHVCFGSHRVRAESESPAFFSYLSAGCRQYYTVDNQGSFHVQNMGVIEVNGVDKVGYIVEILENGKYRFYSGGALAPGETFQEIHTIPTLVGLNVHVLYISSSSTSKHIGLKSCSTLFPIVTR